MKMQKQSFDILLPAIIIPILLSVLLFVSGCFVAKNAKSITLTDEKINAYVAAYSALREAAPGFVREANNDPSTQQLNQNNEIYDKIVSILKEHGLSYPQFVILNAKIGAIFSVIQAESGMTRFENLHQSSNEMLDDAAAEIQRLLQDPDIPEETKEGMRETLRELEQGKDELNSTWKYNKKIADWMIKQTKKLTGLIVSKEDIECVKRNEDKIMEAYVGFPLPYQSDGRLPKVDFNFDM